MHAFRSGIHTGLVHGRHSFFSFKSSLRNRCEIQSGKQVVHHSTGNIGQSEISSRMTIRELFVVETHRMKQCGMQVVHVHFVDDGMMAEFIGLAVRNPGLQSTTGQPD